MIFTLVVEEVEFLLTVVAVVVVVEVEAVACPWAGGTWVFFKRVLRFRAIGEAVKGGRSRGSELSCFRCCCLCLYFCLMLLKLKLRREEVEVEDEERGGIINVR